MSPARFAAAALVALVATALLSAVAGGLLRAGVPLPAGGDWLPRAAVWHAALMICGFMGTVIAIERAVALKARWAWSAPALSAAATATLLAGQRAASVTLLVATGLCFVAVNLALLRRQDALHTRVLVGSAGCWLAAHLLFGLGFDAAAVHGWFAFVIWTIAAERLEMTRLMRRRRAAAPALVALLAVMAGAVVAAPAWPVAAGVAYGAALTGLAAWLLAYDIARVTIGSHGLARYMALCLIAGYLWLAFAGLAWAGAALGLPLRDAALHAVGIGFVFSMMMAHAPVILPAVAGIKLQFGPAFYLPVTLLHLSLLVRLGPGLAGGPWRAAGAALNALAIAAFAATAVAAAIAWRRRHGVLPA
ncbi:hypothetical protein [Ramlibacter sp.]|uniref:hypothetical protein n=1 Tax=Ramlibacter sp. TaxID=1917967 RepID=UPI0035AF3D63